MRHYARRESICPAPSGASLFAELPYFAAATFPGRSCRRQRRVATLVRDPQLRRDAGQPPRFLVAHVQICLEQSSRFVTITTSYHRLDLQRKQPARHHDTAIFFKQRHRVLTEVVRAARVHRLPPNLRLFRREMIRRREMHRRGFELDDLAAHGMKLLWVMEREVRGAVSCVSV